MCVIHPNALFYYSNVSDVSTSMMELIHGVGGGVLNWEVMKFKIFFLRQRLFLKLLLLKGVLHEWLLSVRNSYVVYICKWQIKE